MQFLIPYFSGTLKLVNVQFSDTFYEQFNMTSKAEYKLPTKKFSHLTLTAEGEKRACVDFTALKTLWFNTGTLCNLACENCYIESSPKNDRLTYITKLEVEAYLDEIASRQYPTREIGLTGGEPFMNSEMIPIMEACLSRGFSLLVLTNAMKPMQRFKEDLLRLNTIYGSQLTMRISVDHFSQKLHELERGEGAWQPMLHGVNWLVKNRFTIDIAGRTRWGDDIEELRKGYETLFKAQSIPVNAWDEKQLMLFPEMDPKAEVPEITTKCWDILGVNPNDMMCATSRMVVKRKGADKPAVLACTLLAYDEAFELGETLQAASQSIYLNHPHCAKFCVLGGGSCSAQQD